MKLKVADNGIVIPRNFFIGIEEVEVRKKKNFITIIPKVKNPEYIMDTCSDAIEKLLTSPLKANNFAPFKREEIYERS